MILDLTGGKAREGWLQPLAGEAVWSSFPFAPDARPAPRPDVRPSARGDAESWRLIYDGPGEIDGGVQRIRSFVDIAGCRRIDFDDGESFEIAPDGRVLTRREEGGGADRGAARALAAPLAVALALQRIFLLHASAVAGRSGVLALLAPSGGGKSTLASACETVGLRRIADDQLPTRIAATAVALPHFPQLKLSAAEAYPAGSQLELPLAALIELTPEGSGNRVEIQRLEAREPLLALIRAGVGLKLFDPDLLAMHFVAAAEASSVVPVFRLRFPWGLDRLGEPLAALAELDRRLAETSQPQ